MVKSVILGRIASWYRYQTGVVPVPLMQNKNGIGTMKKCGTGTTHQDMIGTGTNPSGIGTTTPYNPDFLYSYIVNSNSKTEGVRTLVND